MKSHSLNIKRAFKGVALKLQILQFKMAGFPGLSNRETFAFAYSPINRNHYCSHAGANLSGVLEHIRYRTDSSTVNTTCTCHSDISSPWFMSPTLNIALRTEPHMFSQTAMACGKFVQVKQHSDPFCWRKGCSAKINKERLICGVDNVWLVMRRLS